MPTLEEQAREQIDAMLIACGWAIQDYKSSNLGAARGIALREVPLKSGRCDYLLLVDRKPSASSRPRRKEPDFRCR